MDTTLNDTQDMYAVSDNSSTNFSGPDPAYLAMEKDSATVVPIIFGIITFVGFAGNVLVMITVVCSKHMRNTTNLVILNLAVADLLSIILCVPFAGARYALPSWPFGNAFCKIYQYMIHVTVYVCVYTLVLMSLGRYFAVVHPVFSMTTDAKCQAFCAIGLLWIVILSLNIPLLLDFNAVQYTFNNENRSSCLNVKSFNNSDQGKIFYGYFFAFSCLIPLTIMIILYGFMIWHLFRGIPSGNQSAESLNRKKRVTRMVVMVVAVFALCWLPIHVVLMIQNFGRYPESAAFVDLQIASNCLAYMNSCVNPLLYAFVSSNFRESFRKVLCCCK